MKGKKSAVLPTIIATLMVSATVIAADETHWGYSGHQGPQHWGQLSSEFAACSTGKNQFSRDRAYYRFNGSLTTPPCSEGVNWFVMKQFETASTEQIEKFVNAIHQQNNRPVQPINARVIIQ